MDTYLYTDTNSQCPDYGWLDKVLKTGAVTNHNLTISGGSEKFKYYLGVNYYKEDATVYNSDMERYSLRTNITSQLTNFLKLTTIVNLNQNNYTNSTVGGDVGNLRDQGAGALFGAIFYPLIFPCTMPKDNIMYSAGRLIPFPCKILMTNPSKMVTT